MKIIKERRRVTEEYYEHTFVWRHDRSAGFGFGCDKNGNLLAANHDAVKNYNNCIGGVYDVIDCGVQKKFYTYTEPAVGKCSCGEEVCLDSFTNTCDECGADYNMFGQLLAPRSQWGWETNEHWTDCY